MVDSIFTYIFARILSKRVNIIVKTMNNVVKENYEIVLVFKTLRPFGRL